MATERDEYLNLLYKAFEMEYNDVFAYIREADLFRKKIVGGKELGDMFDSFSNIELRHSDRLAMKILELGGAPRWEFKSLNVEKSLHKVLENHKNNEAEACGIYEGILNATRDLDFSIILKGILRDEKEHLEKIVHILGKLEKRG